MTGLDINLNLVQRKIHLAQLSLADLTFVVKQQNALFILIEAMFPKI